MKQEDIMKLEAAIAADYGNIAGMVVRKDGETVYERYFGGCTAESRLNVFSVTKSIISILLGIALDRGCLGSIDQQVLEFFPEYTPKRGEKTIQRITIRDMLTMTAPYKYRSTPYTKYFTSPDWVRFSLDLLGGKGPVGEFRYAPLIGPDILTGILTRVTGQSVLDFAKEHLFAPLGIPVEQSITFRSREELMAFYESTDLRVWAADPAGVNAGGWGLTLSPMDMANIGELILHGGVYSYMKQSNLPSAAVARANGMTLLREYTDAEQEQTAVYGISRTDWETWNISFLERPYEKRETARDVCHAVSL